MRVRAAAREREGMSDFSPMERAVIDRIQRDITLSPRPFADLAGEMGIPEEELISVVRSLKERRVVRIIAAIFNASRLGYASSLVAFACDERDVERAAELVNSHPGVSHNYLRDHRYNMWFTISAEPGVSLDRTVEALASQSKARDYLIFRTERLIKIGFRLAMEEVEDEEEDIQEAAAPVGGHRESAALTEDEKLAVILLQHDLPLERRPLRAIIEPAGARVSEEWLASAGEELKKRGVMRRYAAVLRHQNAGYTANAMTAWKFLNEEQERRSIPVFRSNAHISHLYMRTLHPGRWEYPLFAMIHARGEERLAEIIKGIEEKTGVREYIVLRSIREFKKHRPRYFSPEFAAWNRAHGIGAD